LTNYFEITRKLRWKRNKEIWRLMGRITEVNLQLITVHRVPLLNFNTFIRPWNPISRVLVRDLMTHHCDMRGSSIRLFSELDSINSFWVLPAPVIYNHAGCIAAGVESGVQSRLSVCPRSKRKTAWAPSVRLHVDTTAHLSWRRYFASNFVLRVFYFARCMS